MTDGPSIDVPPLPTGYDIAKPVSAGRRDCHITAGIDQDRNHIPRFLVQLHYLVATDPVQWTVIARMDHNETAPTGHDIYCEGLHVDVMRQTSSSVHLPVTHASLPASRGVVIRGCVDHFRQNLAYFIDVYEERRPPGGPPRWSPDGGTPMFIRLNPLDESMSRESSTEESLSVGEFTELLADVEGTTLEEIERGAAELDFIPPEEAPVLGED
jgi:hypothetical protein